MSTPVYIEAGAKRAFAAALDWPGWCRSGRDEQGALEALIASAPRYAAVAARAGVPFPTDDDIVLDVVERVPGDATTDFGAPGKVPARDSAPLTAEQARTVAALVEAAWTALADVAAGAPAVLRKGPRGGGRDRDSVVAHVAAAEDSYARKLGIRLPVGPAMRAEILRVLGAASDGTPPAGGRWPARYAARRIAWHALDHAWEIEDRSAP